MKGFRWWGVALLFVLSFLSSTSPATAPFIGRRQARRVNDPAADIAALRDQDPLVYESFAEDLDRWMTGNTARSSTAIEQGVLRIRLKRGATSAAAFTGLDLDNFLLEVTAIHRAGPPDYTATVLFRIQDEAAFYAFQVRGTGETALWSAVRSDCMCAHPDAPVPGWAV